MVLRTSKGVKVIIENKPFAKGGEGSVYKVISPYSGMCAKIYHPNKLNRQKQRKIEYMIANPPHLNTKSIIITWPKESLFENNKFVGFLMPLAFNNSIELYELTLLKFKNTLNKIWVQKYSRDNRNGIMARLKLMKNIATAIHSIHSLKIYTLVDLKPQNVLITHRGKISLIDCDSIQISKNNKVIFPARVATLEYIPPESSKINLLKNPVPLSWDRFSLAVIFYQILFGLHPYASTTTGKYQKCTTLDCKIKKGLFVFGKKKKYISKSPRFHNNYNLIPEKLKKLFYRAFETGNHMPDVRPSAEEWAKTLFEVIKKKQIHKPPVKSPKKKTYKKNKHKSSKSTKMFAHPFSFKGRINRLEYVLSIMIFIVAWLFFGEIATEIDTDISFLAIPLLWFLIAQRTKRAHDFGKSGWTQLIPFYDLKLLFKKGDNGNNQYGSNPTV